MEQWQRLWQVLRYDILAFCDWIGYTPSSEQEIFLKHVQYETLYGKAGSKRVLAKSGQGCGKTMGLCVAALWRHLRSPGTITVITAPTAEQCKIVFFSEMQRVVANGPALLRGMLKIDASQLIVRHPKYGQAWKMVARTASNPDALRGLHHPHMTVICEEMSGIDMAIMEVLLGTCSQEDNLMVGIGNPSQREGYFFKAFCDTRTMQNWPRRMTLSREKLSVERPDICAPATIEALENEWGRDSDMFRVAVLGEFPSVSGDTILPYDWVVKAAKTPAWKAVEPSNIKVVATDFARFGGDESVTYQRMGNAIIDERIHQGIEPTQAAREAMHMADQLDWDKQGVTYVVDATGMGQGAVGLYHEQNRNVFEFHNHGNPRMGERKYSNLISRSWFEFRELLYEMSQGKCEVSIPDDDVLINELTSMRYEFDVQNRIKSWSKDKFKKDIGLGSPDRAETLMMAFSKAAQAESRSFAI